MNTRLRFKIDMQRLGSGERVGQMSVLTVPRCMTLLARTPVSRTLHPEQGVKFQLTITSVRLPLTQYFSPLTMEMSEFGMTNNLE